jgi:hypothetical protein
MLSWLKLKFGGKEEIAETANEEDLKKTRFDPTEI